MYLSWLSFNLLGMEATHPVQEEDLAAQQQVHDEDKPHQCIQCGKRFLKQAKLRIHLRVHTGEKPYHCSQCGKHFSQAVNLKKHHVTHHTEERPYRCALCDRTFSLSFSLIKHQRVAHPGKIKVTSQLINFGTHLHSTVLILKTL